MNVIPVSILPKKYIQIFLGYPELYSAAKTLKAKFLEDFGFPSVDIC